MKYWKILALSSVLVACSEGDKTQNKSDDSKPVEKQAVAESTLPEGITLIEKVTSKGDEIVIPYEKYELDNGLTVVIHQDNSDPLAHVDVTYHVGSAREEPGKSGFAHFFEHMMFQGSEHVADEEHFKIVSESGGTLNGTTNFDRTNYFQTVPVNQLEKMLWLEADRMGFLLNAVTQEKFEVQRETVKNERGQRYDNRPYGLVFEKILESLYPKGHPYSTSTIGYIEDLNRVNVNDLKKFFLRWYGPNNATLTIGGAVDVNETLKLVNKYFGTIPRGPEVDMPEKTLVSLDADRYISYEDNVNLPMVAFSYPTVYARHKDEAALDVLAEILGQGKTSLFYKNLVKPRLAVNATASHYCFEISCIFLMQALPNPMSGKSLGELDAIMREAFNEFEKRGVSDDDLQKVKAKLEADLVFGLQSVSGKVGQLAAYETFTGDPNYIQQDVARYSSVTKQDVMRVYNQYIKGNHAVVLSVVPKGKPEKVAKKDTYTPPPRDFVETTETKASDLDIRVANDDFDRSVQPKAGANPLVNLPEFWRAETKNKIRVLGSQTDETPTTTILLEIPGGHYHSSKENAGVASLMASMLNETTTERSNEAMSLELQKLGSRVSIFSTDTSTNVYINALTKNLDKTLELTAEKIMKPAFTEDDFNRLKQQQIQSIKQGKKNPSTLAMQAWLDLLYGDVVAGIPDSGTVTTVTDITLEEVKAFYDAHVKPEAAKLIVVSDLPQNKVLDSMTPLMNWQGKSEAKPRKFAAAKFDPKTVYIVNKDEAAQSVIRIGKHGIARDFTGEFFKAGLMNFNLGGAFNSRINLNLREDKGYTYGARSYFWGDKNMGGYTASASVRADVTAESFIEFLNEITGFQKDGISDEELKFMRQAVGQRDALKYETPRQKLGFMSNILSYDLPDNFVDTQAKIIKTITKEELNQLAKKHLDFDSMLKLVVGDFKTLKPKFEELGYKVEEVELAE